MKSSLPAFAMLLFCLIGGGAPARADPLASVRAQVIAHAPFKQWDLASGAPNRSLGRTPGATCEAISFLAADTQTTGNADARAAATALAQWVAGLQSAAAGFAVPGGVASTPDLASPSNAYYYAIDAALCGTAMLDMAEATGDPLYALSADRFGSFILAMIRKQAAGGGPCEAVVQQPSRAPAYVCERYTKLLVALPLLARLDRRFPGRGYAQAATGMRAALVPGLEGLWEYASGPPGRPQWHRVPGPRQEPDLFAYGDTLAYGVRGLFEYEGASPLVRRLYTRLVTMRGTSRSVMNYDGTIALAGYVDAQAQRPDPFSAYYDIVTLGILHDVKREVAPADFARADAVLRTRVATGAPIPWRMNMALHPEGRQGDISTLAAIGKALLIGAKPRLPY